MRSSTTNKFWALKAPPVIYNYQDGLEKNDRCEIGSSTTKKFWALKVLIDSVLIENRSNNQNNKKICRIGHWRHQTFIFN